MYELELEHIRINENKKTIVQSPLLLLHFLLRNSHESRKGHTFFAFETEKKIIIHNRPKSGERKSIHGSRERFCERGRDKKWIQLFHWLNYILIVSIYHGLLNTFFFCFISNLFKCWNVWKWKTSKNATTNWMDFYYILLLTLIVLLLFQ